MRKYKKNIASLLSIDNQVEVKILLKVVVQFYLFPVASVFVLQR